MTNYIINKTKSVTYEKKNHPKFKQKPFSIKQNLIVSKIMYANLWVQKYWV